MAASAVPALDLPLAWRRVKHDLEHRVFVQPGYELQLIQADLDGWLGPIGTQLEAGHYSPRAMRVVEVPKGGGLLRPGSQLSLSDHLVYTACVGAALEHFHPTLAPLQGAVDFGYRLAGDPKAQSWITNQFEAWRDFRVDSIAKIDSGASCVVVTDLTAFYETIAVPFLLSDLRAAGVPTGITELLNRCLSRWSTHGRGIPQGVSASDLLAKFYLHVVDRTLMEDGIVHTRYVDDIRLFCGDDVSAKKNLNTLISLLRKRGLYVQSGKTKILAAGAARRQIAGAVQTVTDVGGQFIAELREMVPEGYLNWSILEAQLAENPESPPVEILVAAYLVPPHANWTAR